MTKSKSVSNFIDDTIRYTVHNTIDIVHDSIYNRVSSIVYANISNAIEGHTVRSDLKSAITEKVYET